MMIKENDKLPNSEFVWFGKEGIEKVSLSKFTALNKVVIFGLPGAFTPTCQSSHVPSFIRTKKRFEEIGINTIICISVNDPHVLKAWGEITGASAAGLIMLGDPESKFTRLIGMDFTAPDIGLIERSKRYAMYVEDQNVIVFNEEKSRGECTTSAGEGLLDSITKL
ncbi:MAG: peroxiredoxin [Rhodobacteraceae bacterium]|jgi:cytochrome c peroxidase|nr:peroxiredoxin [Paracoccaceae bacterium]